MKSRKAFWDTNILIYWIEQDAAHLDQMKALVEWQESQGIEPVTSAFTLAEILVRPISKGNASMARKYSEIVEKMGCINFGTSEALAYACIQSDNSDLKAPECLQLACAMSHGVDYFVTSEKRLSRFNVDGIGEILYLRGWFDARKK